MKMDWEIMRGNTRVVSRRVSRMRTTIVKTMERR